MSGDMKYWAVYNGWDERTDGNFEMEELKAASLDAAVAEAVSKNPVMELEGLFIIHGTKHDVDLEPHKAVHRAAVRKRLESKEREDEMALLARLKAKYEPVASEPSEPPKCP